MVNLFLAAATLNLFPNLWSKIRLCWACHFDDDSFISDTILYFLDYVSENDKINEFKVERVRNATLSHCLASCLWSSRCFILFVVCLVCWLCLSVCFFACLFVLRFLLKHCALGASVPSRRPFIANWSGVFNPPFKMQFVSHCATCERKPITMETHTWQWLENDWLIDVCCNENVMSPWDQQWRNPHLV